MQIELRDEAFPVENLTHWYNGASPVLSEHVSEHFPQSAPRANDHVVLLAELECSVTWADMNLCLLAPGSTGVTTPGSWGKRRDST